MKNEKNDDDDDDDDPWGGGRYELEAPHTNVAAAFVEALAAEAEGPPKQALTTFMELVAERQ